jgi:hypothetical protein
MKPARSPRKLISRREEEQPMLREAGTWIDEASDDELWSEDEIESDFDDSLDEDLGEAWDEAGDDLEAHEGLVSLLGEGWRNAEPEQLESLYAEIAAAMTPMEAENFWNTVRNIGRQVAPIAGQVLSVAAPIVGTAFGGPVGAAIGGSVGQLAGGALASLGGRPAGGPPPIPPAPPGVAPRAPGNPAGVTGVAGVARAATGAVRAVANTGAGSAPPAVGQLLGFLQNPQLLQSLLGQITGGAQGVTGGAAAPFGAFMNALSVLAGRAAGEAESEPGTPSYLFDSDGRLLADPHSPDERAEALLAHLRVAPAGRFA